MEQSRLLTIDQLVEYIDKYTSDVDTIYKHYHTGTIDVLYTTALNDIVTALMLIPINRIKESLAPTEENEDVAAAVEKITHLLATMCGKSTTEVQRDVLKAIHKFPASDVREATFLRLGNRLN